MTLYTLLTRASRLAALVTLLLIASVAPSRADNVPDSTNAIKSVLPDSISLDGKVVYVDFWASWCVPCRHSFPWMQDLYDKYHSQGLEIVAVNVDKDHQAALKFLKDTNAGFPVVFDSTGSLAGQYDLDVMPSSFVYGRDGHLASRHRGFRPEETDSLDYIIRHLINEGKTE